MRFSENLEMEKDEELVAMMDKAAAGLLVYEAGSYKMTDDKAPVELLSIQVIDELIRDEVQYYSSIYETKGIRGLLNEL